MKFNLRWQSTGKVYPYMERFVHLMMRGFFSKVYVNNRKGVPSDRPVLLAANHPTAFLDPVLLGVNLDPPIYNMTRGDIFQKPFFRKLMESVNMFPVYRMRDGYGERSRNDEVFEYCVDKLYHKRVVTIYVEGEHHLEKHVRPIQKGIIRIAFAAMERHQIEDLQIIPAGCTYRYGDRARDEVAINIGAPILLRDYWEAYQENPARTVLELRQKIENALKTVCLHIEKQEDYALAEQLLALQRSVYPVSPLPVVQYNTAHFSQQKALCDRINLLHEPEKSTLKEQANRYFNALQTACIDDESLMLPARARGWYLLLFALLSIPFLIGFISSWPLMRFTYWVADTKVRKKEFYSSIVMGVGMLGGMLYYFVLLVAAVFTLKAVWIALAALFPLLGWFAMFYREMWKRWRMARKAFYCPEKEMLLGMREEIAGYVEGG